LSASQDQEMSEHITKSLESIRKNLLKSNLQEPPPRGWADTPPYQKPVRGVPNSALRGALFSAIQGKNRRHLKREILASQNGIQIRFTGWQLDQSDLDVWEQAIYLARQHPLETQCEFTTHAFLKAIARNTGKTQHEWLKGVFARLAGAAVEITHGNQTYFGALINGGTRDELTGRYVINLNPHLSKLYQAGWTAINWEQRRQLQRKPLALWLQGFLASHAQPYPLRVERIMNWSGSKTKEACKFKQNLKKALDELRLVGAITNYTFDKNLLIIIHTPNAAQKRYLSSMKRTSRQARHTR